MTLAYCEVCGAQLEAHVVVGPEGAICEACLTTRRAVVDAEPAAGAPLAVDAVQFNCCYCRSLLRLKPVQKRTKIKCPRCGDAFYLTPDGRVEARLEGNTTAMLSAQPPRPLEGATPATGSPPLGKTQPIRRQEVSTGDQQALLDELKPKARPVDFLSSLPQREEAPLVDTDSYATAPLDLSPGTGVRSPPPSTRPVPRPAGKPAAPALRPSEEGKVDLDLEGLKRKTQKFARGGPAPAPGSEVGPVSDRPGARTRKPAAADAAPAEEAAPDPRQAEREARREEKERRAAEAARRTEELEAQAARRSLSALSLSLLAIAPALVALGLTSMTARGSGFATRGVFGERLRDLGGVVDRGVRSFGSTVNPALPEGWRLPAIEERR